MSSFLKSDICFRKRFGRMYSIIFKISSKIIMLFPVLGGQPHAAHFDDVGGGDFLEGRTVERCELKR